MSKSKQQGFTLIEVMITVAIVAILSAIALPAYQDYIKRGRIVDGVAPLANMQVSMEQYFQDKRKYGGACDAPGTLAALPAETSFFVFSCPTLEADGYVIWAKGKGAMADFEYKIKQDKGVITRSTESMPTGWGPKAATCWSLKKDGSC